MLKFPQKFIHRSMSYFHSSDFETVPTISTINSTVILIENCTPSWASRARRKSEVQMVLSEYIPLLSCGELIISVRLMTIQQSFIVAAIICWPWKITMTGEDIEKPWCTGVACIRSVLCWNSENREWQIVFRHFIIRYDGFSAFLPLQTANTWNLASCWVFSKPHGELWSLWNGKEILLNRVDLWL